MPWGRAKESSLTKYGNCSSLLHSINDFESSIAPFNSAFNLSYICVLSNTWNIVVANTEEVVSLAAEIKARASCVMRSTVFSCFGAFELRTSWKMDWA